MPKLILAKKNKEKNSLIDIKNKKSVKQSTINDMPNSIIAESELVSKDLSKDSYENLDTSTKKTITSEKIIKITDDDQTKIDNQIQETDEDLNSFELLDNEDFDLENEDNFLLSNDTDYFDESDDLSEIERSYQKNYAIDVYNHKKELPIVLEKNLPSTLIQDNLQLYIREINKFPLLNPEEEIELSRKVRDEGDPKAAFRIISSHLRLVVKVAMSFQRRWMQNVLDLIQEGNVGLMRAINKFDPDKGIKFSYYATFWVKAYILKFIMDNWRMVKIGTTQAQRKLFYNLNKEKQRLISQGFDPDASTLSDALGVSVDQVIEMQQRLNTSDMSLDMPINDEHGSASKVDFFPALGPGIEDSYATSEMADIVQDKIAELLPELSEKEIFILKNRLLTDDPITLREIGEKYDVTRERIRQLEARLLVKIKNHFGEEIKDFSESWIQN